MFLPPVPVFDWLPDRAAVLPRLEERRPAAGALAVIVATTGLVVAYVVGRVLGYDAGTAAGVIAGSLTESATIGTAGDAIRRAAVCPRPTRVAMTNRIPVAFAVTYLVGVVGAAWFLAQLAPRLMGINLAEECRKLEEETGRARDYRQRGGAKSRPEPTTSTARIAARRAAACATSRPRATRCRALIVERDETARSDARSRRNDEVLAGDTLAIAGRREAARDAARRAGTRPARESTTRRCSTFRPKSSTSS